MKPDGKLVKKHYTAMHELDGGKACLYIIDKPKCSLLVMDQPVTISKLYASMTGLKAEISTTAGNKYTGKLREIDNHLILEGHDNSSELTVGVEVWLMQSE